MEDNENLFESLIERANEYGKTSYELAKLKLLDKASEVVSSFIPYSVIVALIGTFILFLSLGFALMLGDILGKLFWGFFAVAGFYIIAGIVIRLFMFKMLKRLAGDYFIKNVLK
jgi:hypothetical protein